MGVNQLIQLRHGTAATWTSVNPVLALGEVGVETDTKLTKVGDGATAWSSLAYSSSALRLDQFAAPTSPVSLGSQKLQNLANGVASSDGATMGQLASAIAGLQPAEAPVQTVGSGLTHSGIGQVIAGYTVAAGDRILDTAAAIPSGLWIAAAGAWTRSVDFATGSNAQGKFVQSESGAGWALLSTTPVIVDTTSQVWTQIVSGSININGGTP